MNDRRFHYNGVADAMSGRSSECRVASETGREAGYVMTLIVILMPVLIGFVALAIDATYYWFRSVELQRVSDAASLAGVTRMPKFNEAVSAAREVAKRNGFVDGAKGIEVKYQRINRNNKRFRVVIKDNNTGIFFGRIFKSNWAAERGSTAEYISNIPLGSRENAIGTGYLSDSGAVQNFWLGLSGPCAPKEAGDQFMARWDGNAVNPNIPANRSDVFRKFAALCHVDPATSNNKTGPDFLLQERAKYPANLFPAVVDNRDYAVGKTGYDYIINVPCTNQSEPPPCPSSETMPGDLVIEVYDPVFNPDSIQRFGTYLDSAGRTRPETNEVDDRLRIDKYGVIRPKISNCVSIPSGLAAPQPARIPAPACTNVTIDGLDPATGLAVENPKPWDVRVDTDIRLFPPDGTPLDYSDDTAMTFNSSTVPNVVKVADRFVDVTEVNRVRRFGSCIRWTDEWTSYTPTGNPGEYAFVSNPYIYQQSTQAATLAAARANALGLANPDFAPAAAPSGYTADVETWKFPTAVSGQDNYTQTLCQQQSNKWVEIAKIPAASARGRYRLNIRTIDALESFGQNGFGIRSYFIPTGTSPVPRYPDCLKNPVVPPTPLPPACGKTFQISSVAGDSTMSVFASVNSVSSFYLAQLMPARLYRGKTVIISLWDPGEGADRLQVLRPKGREQLAAAPTDSNPLKCVRDPIDTTYCVQRFSWTVGRIGIARYNSANPDEGVSGNAPESEDVCMDKGEPGPAATTNPDFLPVSGDAMSTTAIPGCTVAQDTNIFKSRNYADGTDNDPSLPVELDKRDQRKFNDRLVTVAVKVPDNYGCTAGTGVPDAAGYPIECADLTDAEMNNEMESGWWRLKYTPQTHTTGPLSGQYKQITDRTTWSVGLRGDPVHLVPDGQ